MQELTIPAAQIRRRNLLRNWDDEQVIVLHVEVSRGSVDVEVVGVDGHDTLRFRDTELVRVEP